MITVHHKFIKTAPRKIRVVLDAVRGLPLEIALAKLHLSSTQASKDVYSTLYAAGAAAKDRGLVSENLIISRAICDEGPRLKRRIMISRGRARPIQKQLAHIRITVAPTTASTANKGDAAATAKSIKLNHKENSDGA